MPTVRSALPQATGNPGAGLCWPLTASIALAGVGGLTPLVRDFLVVMIGLSLLTLAVASLRPDRPAPVGRMDHVDDTRTDAATDG
jgi:hypothetical protein